MPMLLSRTSKSKTGGGDPYFSLRAAFHSMYIFPMNIVSRHLAAYLFISSLLSLSIPVFSLFACYELPWALSNVNLQTLPRYGFAILGLFFFLLPFPNLWVSIYFHRMSSVRFRILGYFGVVFNLVAAICPSIIAFALIRDYLIK